MAEDPVGKRKLPTKVEAMKARKRQKLGLPATITAKPKTGKIVSNKGLAVRPDQLKWKPIDMPDKFDDFEGFYGLEEIDDVDVIRDPRGVLSYRSINGQSNIETVGGKRKEAPSDDEDDLNGDAPGDEFEGFGDDDEGEKPTVDGILEPPAAPKVVKSAAAIKLKAKKEARKEAKKEAKKAGKQEAKSAQSKQTVSIDALEDDVEDKGADISAWKSLKLSPDTLAGLSRLGFSKPTKIQSAAIPDIMAGHDVVGKASTGSGKTLAFGIPIFETFLELAHERTSSEQKTPIALIMAPTRELAHQLEGHLKELCKGLPVTPPSIATLTGGLSLQKQQRLLKTADIVVGTPGRLWEIISTGQGVADSIKQIRYLVVDEADRLLSAGHFKELEEIMNVLDQDITHDEGTGEGPHTEETKRGERQTLVFSATFHKGLQQKLSGKGRPDLDKKDSMEYLLAKLKFREEKPKYIDVNPQSQMASGLKEGLVECGGTEKDLYLYSILLMHPTSRTLIFVNSISAVRRITPFLQNLNLPALALHSQMAQKARLRSIEKFSGTYKTSDPHSTKGSILVATDVAARGLDIPHVQLVVHYHLPRAADTYVHRSGRTARAGETGNSILICGPEEVAGTRRLVAKVHAQTAVAAQMSRSEAARNGYFIRSLDIDRRVVARLKDRATLAKQLADATGAKEKQNSNDDIFKQAAEDLGVDYDSEELEKQGGGKRGRGAGRKKKEREAREMSKDEMRALRGELNAMLKQRVNVGVSERYPTAGTIDIDELLKDDEGVKGEFLGSVKGLGLDD